MIDFVNFFTFLAPRVLFFRGQEPAPILVCRSHPTSAPFFFPVYDSASLQDTLGSQHFFAVGTLKCFSRPFPEWQFCFSLVLILLFMCTFVPLPFFSCKLASAADYFFKYFLVFVTAHSQARLQVQVSRYLISLSHLVLCVCRSFCTPIAPRGPWYPWYTTTPEHHQGKLLLHLTDFPNPSHLSF